MKIAYWIVTGIFCLMIFAATAVEIFQFSESVKMLGALQRGYIQASFPNNKIVINLVEGDFGRIEKRIE